MTGSLNEETVKNRIIVPYLNRLGIPVQDLEFETSFSLRLGRHVVSPQIPNRLPSASSPEMLARSKRESCAIPLSGSRLESTANGDFVGSCRPQMHLLPSATFGSPAF